MTEFRDAFENTDMTILRCQGLCAALSVLASDYLSDKSLREPEAHAIISLADALAETTEKALEQHQNEWRLVTRPAA